MEWIVTKIDERAGPPIRPWICTEGSGDDGTGSKWPVSDRSEVRAGAAIGAVELILAHRYRVARRFDGPAVPHPAEVGGVDVECEFATAADIHVLVGIASDDRNPGA